MKTVNTKYMPSGPLCTAWELQQEGGRALPASRPAGTLHRGRLIFTALHTSLNDCEGPAVSNLGLHFKVLLATLGLSSLRKDPAVEAWSLFFFCPMRSFVSGLLKKKMFAYFWQRWIFLALCRLSLAAGSWGCSWSQ